MSHIDEGELTAYADGAYPPEDADAQRIAAHIAECANCRNRLAQAQMLSGRASEILAVAAPSSVEAPPFEQIAASVPRRTNTRRRAVPLSWAASIVLAAGLGWFGRDALNEPDAGLRTTPVQTEAKVSAPEAPAMNAPAMQTPQPQPGLSAGAGARVDTRAGSVGAANPAVAANELAQDAVSEATAPTAAPDEKLGREEEVRVEGGRSVGRVAAASPVAPPSAPSPALSKSLRAQAAGAAASDLAVGSIKYITAAEAEERKLLVLHIVPELEIVRIGLTGTGVQVEQKLPDGKIVTFTSERAEAAREFAASARKAEAARNEAEAPVVVVRSGVNVKISGALPADSLRVLGAKVR